MIVLLKTSTTLSLLTLQNVARCTKPTPSHSTSKWQATLTVSSQNWVPPLPIHFAKFSAQYTFLVQTLTLDLWTEPSCSLSNFHICFTEQFSLEGLARPLVSRLKALQPSIIDWRYDKPSIYRLLHRTASAQTHSSKFCHKRMKKSQAPLDLAENYTVDFFREGVHPTFGSRY